MIIVGAQGSIESNILLEKINKLGSPVQVFDASYICGKDHILVAYEHAKRAFEDGRNTCKTIEMELILYASCRRQIKDALDLVGAKNCGDYAFVFFELRKKPAERFITEDLKLKIDNCVLHSSIEKLKKFVDEKELEAVDKTFYFDLLFEKIAMVELMK